MQQNVLNVYSIDCEYKFCSFFHLNDILFYRIPFHRVPVDNDNALHISKSYKKAF
jgi:hypothetical protein